MARERVYAEFQPTAPGRIPGVEVQFHADGATVGVATGDLVDATCGGAVPDPDPDATTTPCYVWLDRRRVNDLIRKLRRARNSAWGADE